MKQKTTQTSSSEADDGALTWRSDPKETFSDWTINVFVACIDSGKAKLLLQGPSDVQTAGETPELAAAATYRVHKVVLACGKRRSKLLARHFRKAGEHENSRHTLPLPVAEAFPLALDYIYCKDGPLETNCESAAALHYLGVLFEIQDLCRDCLAFMNQNVSQSNLGEFYRQAKAFGDELLLHSVASQLGQRILDVGMDSHLLREIDPKTWVVAFQSKGAMATREESEHKSKLLCRLKRYHWIDQATIAELTNEGTIPRIHPSVALALAELENKPTFPAKQNDVNAPASGKDKNCVLASASFQSRCAKALAETWKETALFESVTRELLDNRGSAFILEFTFASLQKAQKELDKAHEQTRSAEEALQKKQREMTRCKASLRKNPRRVSPSHRYVGFRIGAGENAFRAPVMEVSNPTNPTQPSQ
ncbi:expressed unknown protein [Seminavis robusta]|uniref:BTB domain-containing protein n=1 Tax=Seminavis robusta TaxID=568900 RepID=A0A9N8F338_9STRA|nr:expressed unknown protein [Seminavis robusta]|eukprot:Sro2985_g341630.1 n/a (422) ;mRNA; r:3428-4693